MLPLTVLAIVGLAALVLFLSYFLFCIISAVAYKHVGFRVEYHSNRENEE